MIPIPCCFYTLLPSVRDMVTASQAPAEPNIRLFSEASPSSPSPHTFRQLQNSPCTDHHGGLGEPYDVLFPGTALGCMVCISLLPNVKGLIHVLHNTGRSRGCRSLVFTSSRSDPLSTPDSWALGPSSSAPGSGSSPAWRPTAPSQGTLWSQGCSGAKCLTFFPSGALVPRWDAEILVGTQGLGAARIHSLSLLFPWQRCSSLMAECRGEKIFGSGKKQALKNVSGCPQRGLHRLEDSCLTRSAAEQGSTAISWPLAQNKLLSQSMTDTRKGGYFHLPGEPWSIPAGPPEPNNDG